MTAETDLLPCPWCGEKLANVSVSEGSTFRWRKVDGCCADGPEVRHHTMADDQEAAEIESRAAAINAWNRRACVSSATEALRAEVDEARATLRAALDASTDGEPLRVLAIRASNALYWRTERAERAEARADRLAEALQRLVNSFPAEYVFLDAGWDATDVEEACEAYDAARAALEQETTNG